MVKRNDIMLLQQFKKNCETSGRKDWTDELQQALDEAMKEGAVIEKLSKMLSSFSAHEAIRQGSLPNLKNSIVTCLDYKDQVFGASCLDMVEDILVTASVCHQRKCFDYICKFYSDDHKEKLKLIWASANQSNKYFNRLFFNIVVSEEDVQKVAFVALMSNRLDNFKILLPAINGKLRHGSVLGYAIMYNKKDLFDYLLTTQWTPKQKSGGGRHESWNSILESCVQSGFWYGFDQVLPKCDLSIDCWRVLWAALEHQNESVGRVYALYSSSDIKEIVKEFDDRGYNKFSEILRERLANEEYQFISNQLCEGSSRNNSKVKKI